MAATTPFLAAGLPGLTFGLSLGRGLSIQLDPAGHIADEEHVTPEEETAYTKNVSLPTGMLVIHFYALHDLVVPDMMSEMIVYAIFSIGSVHKVSSQKEYNVKNSRSVFNEIKMLPFVVSTKPTEAMNKLVVVVYGCKFGEEHAISRSKHKVIGRYEMLLHKLLKNVTLTEKANLLSKKGSSPGQIEFESCISYGSFGYGQSYQMKTNIHTPRELVKTSLLPRLPPDGEELHTFRGTTVDPRKLKHPPFIPLQNDPVESFEPDLSSTKSEPALKCPTFPLLIQHMQRINQLRSVLEKQPNRTKRICFLRKLLQDNMEVPTDEHDEASDDENNQNEAPIPQALALLMNATRFFSHAPGIIQRRRASARPSLPVYLSPEDRSSSSNQARAHSNSLAPFPSNANEMKDVMFTRRRQSIAPTFK